MNGERKQSPAAGPSANRRPTILVVEDEVLVRAAVAAFLRDADFTVLEAANAAEAIRIVEVDRSVSLVFTDIDMPGTMDGVALAQWIRRERPGIEVLLTSGAGRATTGSLEGWAGFLPKPYRYGELERRIHALLKI